MMLNPVHCSSDCRSIMSHNLCAFFLEWCDHWLKWLELCRIKTHAGLVFSLLLVTNISLENDLTSRSFMPSKTNSSYFTDLDAYHLVCIWIFKIQRIKQYNFLNQCNSIGLILHQVRVYKLVLICWRRISDTVSVRSIIWPNFQFRQARKGPFFVYSTWPSTTTTVPSVSDFDSIFRGSFGCPELLQA